MFILYQTERLSLLKHSLFLPLLQKQPHLKRQLQTKRI
jgi:hypothetical protein